MIFFESIYEVCKKLPKEDRAQIYDAVIAYGCEGIEPENLSMLAEAVFGMAKPLIDRSNKCKAAGMKGGRPRKEKPRNKDEPTDEFTQEMIAIQREHDEIFDAMENAGFEMNNTTFNMTNVGAGELSSEDKTWTGDATNVKIKAGNATNQIKKMVVTLADKTAATVTPEAEAEEKVYLDFNDPTIHKDFNVKIYGYTQLYKFIDSIPGLAVRGDKNDRKVVATS
jgi:hypothetical protein